MNARKLFIFLPVCLVFVCFSALSSPLSLSSDKYDRQFKSATAQYMPSVDWRLLKAQCYQESLLDPDAVSYVGAQGLCQFMPATWADMPQSKQGSAFMPSLSIKAAAYYMHNLRSQWSTPRPEFDRHSLALASYNAGLGNLVSAQRICDMATLYICIVECLPQVTGRHSQETKTYVERIWGFYLTLKFG